ncbi:hypothetical protein [Paraflavitalea pollutisoli]|uniref:hypothetical protein n=1 Tax=Paraflavitalea pollutisoli TaxID=3034143 RepID=UPI0023ED8607|nr:hypothetical protein [Paraflavitalea sp. H1-2-19X]
MPEQQSLPTLQALTDRWTRNNRAGALLTAIAAALPVAALAYFVANLPLWGAALSALVVAIVVLYSKRPRTLTTSDISSYLNHTYPELEESTQLLLVPTPSLNLLQQLQVTKITPVLEALPAPPAVVKPVTKGFWKLFAGVLISITIIAGSMAFAHQRTPSEDEEASTAPVITEKILPGISGFSVHITPPAYTHRAARQQQQFTVKAETGSLVQWTIHTNQPLHQVQLVFNAKDTLLLQPAAGDSTQWALQKDLQETGFYQVVLAGQASQLYTLEAIPDQPVDIHILTPKQYSVIEPGRAAVSNLSVQLSDDYGIRQAGIVATKASGKGESVSFQEQQLSFNTPVEGQQQITLHKTLDLHALGLKAGDELYFYIKALDNHGQESRSDMYFISLPDTAELLSMSGMESGISQVPEYFRSQRQIIIDIEKLLKEQPAIPADSFKQRSNILGDDQKLLRLRYGKFVGEEWESGGHTPGDGHDHDGEHAGEEHGEEKHAEQTVPIGDIKAIEDQYAHKHDNAEDASYLEPAQKAQLKLILNEMWSSELKLRTYYPREALPYAYKALRMLKDMQQKSRAYVSKTSVKMPPLKPEKRLTGELDKIGTPTASKQAPQVDERAIKLAQALTQLEALKHGQYDAALLLPALTHATQLIGEQAVKAPADYLAALNALRTIREGPDKASKALITKAQAALQRLQATPAVLPQQAGKGAAGSLTDAYYKHLKANSR